MSLNFLLGPIPWLNYTLLVSWKHLVFQLLAINSQLVESLGEVSALFVSYFPQNMEISKENGPSSLSPSPSHSLSPWEGKKKKKQIKILKRKFLKTRKVTFSPSSCGWTHVPSIINKEILNVQTKHMYLHSTESIFFPSYTPRSYQSLLINPDHLT